MCSFKTLHGLEPPTRYDAKHCMSTSIANGSKTSKEELVIDGKPKKQSKPSNFFIKNHLKLLLVVVKEGGNANSQQMTRQKIGFETQKPHKVQVWKRLKKVARWVVDRSHSTIEQDSGYTSTPTSTSPSKDQHSDGLHLIKVNIAKKVKQLSMHIAWKP